MSSKFPWAVNPLKEARAVAEVEKAGKKATDAGYEEAVKVVYKRIAGLVLEAGEDLEKVIEKSQDAVIAKQISAQRATRRVKLNK